MTPANRLALVTLVPQAQLAGWLDWFSSVAPPGTPYGGRNLTYIRNGSLVTGPQYSSGEDGPFVAPIVQAAPASLIDIVMYDEFENAAALSSVMRSGLPSLTQFINLINAQNLTPPNPSTLLFAPVVTSPGNATRGFVMCGFDWGGALDTRLLNPSDAMFDIRYAAQSC